MIIIIIRDFDMYWTSISSIRQLLYVLRPISAPYLLLVALDTKMADAQVEYKHID